MYLRAFQPHDLPALCDLDEACFEQPFRFSRPAMRRFAGASNASVRLACAGEEAAVPGRIEGFAIVHLEHTQGQLLGYVVTLDVAPAARGRGLATALMQDLEKVVAEARGWAVSLHVYAQNQPAIRLYERLGYALHSTEPNFYGRGLDALAYTKLL